MDNSKLEAKEVYVVMQNNYRISRNIRAQWFFKHLNKTLTFKWKTCQRECTEEIEVISAIPKNMENFKVDSETNSSCIKIVPDTKVNFLSTQYRLVFCLDLSSSVSTIDIQHDNICFEEIYSSLEQSLKSLSEPFFVPGSRYFFIPQLYITVVAHVPNWAMAAPQVLIQGWILIPENINMLLDCLRKKLMDMCKVVQKVSTTVQDEQIQFMMPHDASGAVIDGTIDGNKMIKKVLDLSADISTLKIIRYGILALQLLPENSSAGIIVITDGVISFPNCKSLDALLSQLRNSTIACSFIQLGSLFHPFASFGRVPYKELMEFISTATCGAYFPACKERMMDTSRVNEMNVYHKALLFWNFQKTTTSYFLEAYEPSSIQDNYWKIENPHFYTVAHQSRVHKKHTEGTLKVSLENLLSCRLREGYSVKSVVIDEVKNSTEVVLALPWMLSTNIEYIITSTPARKSAPDIPSCHFEVIVDGCYEFLHDVTCSDKKPIKSMYRKTVIAQFWNYIKNLSNTDQILMQLHSFSHNPVYYTIPDSIKNGVPLFYFPNNSSMPVSSSKNVANMQFTSFWKPLCMLDINVWQKWMHAHRIGIILQHDKPLPKNLHLPNPSGRYVHVQCRQATTALNSLLSEYSSFALVENHSYIKLLFDDPDKPPFSFYVIRVTSKPPCVVLRLAFLGGLPGHQRYEIVNDLRQKILSLKRCTSKDSQSSKQLSSNPPESCCFLLKKPVEKILIRYEKLPTNFLTSIPDNEFSDRVSGSSKYSDSYLYADALITLSKYLQQQRWLWTLQYEANTSLALTSASKILYTITNIRLEEGFRFAHSGSGIIYMVQEIPVKVYHGDVPEKLSKEVTNCCVVQYILFPPHTNTTLKDSTSEDDDIELAEADGELQLITECWVEPQLGITSMPSKHKYLDGLTFSDISNALHKKDIEAVTVLTTFEHLCTICEKTKPIQLLPLQRSEDCHLQILHSFPSVINPQVNVRPLQDNISVIPYCFSLLSLLPKCPQTEIVISALHGNSLHRNDGGEAGNEILFNFFIENIKCFHQGEILFTVEDCFIFPFIVHHRPRNFTENPAPFPHPVSDRDLSPILKQSFLPDNKSCCNASCSLINECDFSQKPSNVNAELKEECIAKWRCFVKGCSPNHVILTIIPATFSDLKKLYPQDSNLPPDDNVEMPTENPKSDADEIPEDEACMEECENVPNVDVPEDSVQEDINMSSTSELLHIPLYVYNGVSSSIVNQLVSLSQCEKISDSHMRYAFEYENCVDGQSNISTAAEVSSKHNEESQQREESESQAKKPKKDSHYFNLKDHYSLIEKSHSKAFVYSVYRSLLQDIPVHKFDAIAAIDEICEESLIEVDITEFVSMLCGHVKDFTVKHSVKQMHRAGSIDTGKAAQEDKTEAANTDADRNSGKVLFPLSLLQKHQPCEHLQQKHLDIKEKFMNIIKSFFKAIPSRSDYFYFNYVEEDVEEASLRGDEEESHKEDSLQDESLVEFGEEFQGNELDKASNILEDVASAKSLNTDSSLPSLDKDTEPTCSDKNLYPPLFVHFSCSVRKNKQEIKSCPLSSLPTCLNDIISCLDAECNEIDLEDLRITLDITCLTVPSDIESPNVERHRVYSTSFSSSSPVPEAEFYRKRQNTDEDNDSDISEAPSDTIQGGTLQNLSHLQKEAVLKCIDKIKWLLQDEKASVSLTSFPITSEILNMVIQHVESSKDKPCCIIEKIPLMFIYGTDSLSKFVEAFKRMSPVGYRLEEVNETYYLVLDAEAAKKLNCPFGSLEPPLGIAHKFQIVKSNPHADDRTELNKIAEEMKDPAGFHDYPFLSRTHSDGLNDDLKPSSLDSTAMFNLLRDKGSRKFQQDDNDSDSDDDQQPKSKFHRKVSMKKYDTFPHTSKRTHSTPVFSDCERKKSAGDRPSTAPPKLDSSTIAESSSWEFSTWKRKNYSHSENVDKLSLELPPGSPTASSPDPFADSKDLKRTSSVSSINRFKPSDSVGSPLNYSEAECGSFPFSNTEDGYDGDSSDTGSDWDWLSTVDTRRPVLPKFWLIMNVSNEKVFVYFHMRDRNEDDAELIESKNILNEVISIVTNICKEVNQVLLLLSLYETRKCNRLLVPEDNDDLWKNRDSEESHSFAIDEGDLTMEGQEKYLEATLKLEPGAFSCPVVWLAHFRLHHRLTTTNPGTTKSQGMQALRSVLSTFSVINRENMFVYQEDSGSVFYLRLFEEHCEDNHLGICKLEDNTSLLGSCSSLHSIPFRKTNESDFEDFRPRVNSGASDSYRQDSISTTSGSKKAQKCVALYVHGIGEVGSAITNDLTQVLQNRLNESILDVLIGMLSRNPQCMLTPEDVQFIQNLGSSPTHEIHFTLPVKLLGYAHSIQVYLRQNMLNFLYNPKYTDSKLENHFRPYPFDPTDNNKRDEDVFLHYSKPASGQTGGKGISCIILSLVTGQGERYRNLSNIQPSQNSYQDGLIESEYEDLISTSKYTIKNKSPGPVALIQFHIWSVGKDSIKFLEHRLECAVRQAIWDLLMEYRALTAPILDVSPYDDSGCFSEPTTPIKGIFKNSALRKPLKKLKYPRARKRPKQYPPSNLLCLVQSFCASQLVKIHPSTKYPIIALLGKGMVRRSGTAGIDSSLQMKDFYSNLSLQATKEISSSVPDISDKDFSIGPQSAKPNIYSESLKSVSKVHSSPSTVKADKGNLNVMFHTMLEPFLQHGNALSCPALQKYVYTLPARQSVSLVAKDFLSILKNVSRETPYMYYEIKRPASGLIEYIPFNPTSYGTCFDNNKPGTLKNFVCIGRNEIQWKTYIGRQDFKVFQDGNSEHMKGFQKYQTHVCAKKPEIKKSEPPIDSVPNSPTVRSSSTSVGSPQARSSSLVTQDCGLIQCTYPAFVPRQRLFLMYIKDKEITLYLYNWSQEVILNLHQQLTKRISWHQQRYCLLNNIVLQKLGIFHGLTNLRLEKVNIKEDKQSTIKNQAEEAIAAGPTTIEQLIHNNSSYKESHATSSSKTTVSRSAYLRSLKNLKPKVPFHLSSSAKLSDPVTAHGLQYIDAITTQRRDMQVLYNMWHSRGSNNNYPAMHFSITVTIVIACSAFLLSPMLYSRSRTMWCHLSSIKAYLTSITVSWVAQHQLQDRVFNEVKQSARLSHYCFTPILFNPSWRWKLAPIRDHALEPLDQSLTEKLEPLISNRSRHSSGSSLKNIESSGSSASSSLRSRRLSGNTANSSSNQSSPKLRMKALSEESWHNTFCRHYLQEYVQYLITLGFVYVQATDTTSTQSNRRSAGGEEDKLSRSDSFSHRHGRGPPVFYLIRCFLGGLLVFEIGLSEPYAYGHLYSIEASRFKACNTRTLNSQFIAGFLDDLDKTKLLMHLHSFTYDYHLRTIHSYISGRQLIFRHGYHLTSFLDDFIKYYQKAPTGAHNLVHAGTITITDINMSGCQLYNYIISHNQLYGMTVLRMVPVIIDCSVSIDTEFALGELTCQKASYKDFNDVFQMGNFDFGLLINQNVTEVTADSNTLVLNYYIILTSQRYLYPKLSTFENTRGKFQTVRYGPSQTSSSYSSRKTSSVTIVPEREKFESSGEESTNSSEGRSRKINAIRGMCDEDVTYLGYFSSQETMIQEILLKQSEVAQTHLEGVVHRAAIHCRRDSLWSSLLPRSLKDENSSREHFALSPTSFADFSELLELVSVIPLCDIDEKLTPFMNMSLSWYLSLAPVLKAKYIDSHREYKSPDGNAIHVVVTNIQCPDSFLLLTVDLHSNRSDLSVVFRENPGDVERMAQEEPNLRTAALHSFIESFVNVCSFHLWSSML